MSPEREAELLGEDVKDEPIVTEYPPPSEPKPVWLGEQDDDR